MYDAIVVGARCAGSPTAMLLAQKGYSVLLVDRDTFPSDTLSTALMLPDAVMRMQRWGLLDQLIAVGTPPQQATAYLKGMRLPAPPAPISLYAPRRTVLDKILIDGARAAGVDVREGFSVRNITRDPSGAVLGIEGRHQETEVTESAQIVIGADGRNSLVAKSVGAEEYDVVAGTTCGFYSYYSGIDTKDAELHLAEKCAAFFFPSNDDLVCVAMEAPQDAWEVFRAGPEKHMLEVTREKAPSFAARLGAGKREERWYGMSARTSFYRKPHGPGWALVGDAGFLKDPILGSGINDAFRDAELLTDAVDAGLSGRQDLDEALGAYEQTRNRLTKQLYDVTCEFAELRDPTLELMMKMVGAREAAAA